MALELERQRQAALEAERCAISHFALPKLCPSSVKFIYNPFFPLSALFLLSHVSHLFDAYMFEFVCDLKLNVALRQRQAALEAERQRQLELERQRYSSSCCFSYFPNSLNSRILFYFHSPPFELTMYLYSQLAEQQRLAELERQRLAAEEEARRQAAWADYNAKQAAVTLALIIIFVS